MAGAVPANIVGANPASASPLLGFVMEPAAEAEALDAGPDSGPHGQLASSARRPCTSLPIPSLTVSFCSAPYAIRK